MNITQHKLLPVTKASTVKFDLQIICSILNDSQLQQLEPLKFVKNIKTKMIFVLFIF